MRNYKVIAVDFDNTLFETDYPHIVRPILPVIEMAKARQEKGDKLILWTCREGAELDAAVEACREQGLEFDAVNDNLEEAKAEWGNNPRKVAADEYWDDKAMNIQGFVTLSCLIKNILIEGNGEKKQVGKIDPAGLVNFEPTED